jgi:hypothetical protein
MTTTPVRRRTTPRPASQRSNAPARQTKPPVAEEEAVERRAPARPVGHAILAAERAIRQNTVHLSLPVVGELHLPPTEELVFLGGTAFLAVVGILEWPVALLLGAGHTLATSGRNKVVRALGETLEEV